MSYIPAEGGLWSPPAPSLQAGPAPGLPVAALHLASVAWVAIADATLAQDIASELAHRGWNVGLVTTEIAPVIKAMQAEIAPGPWPALLISGLRFEDGDAFQLIRHMASMRHPPPLALVSHQQRAVIRAALALASMNRVRVAGVSELPDDIGHIVQRTEESLRALGRPLPRGRQLLPALQRGELEQLLQAHTIVPYFQPKLRMDTQEVVGFEALMRGLDRHGRLVTPDRLIAPLVANGLLGQATLHIAQHTLDFVASCLRRGMGISASINVSLGLMSDGQFCTALLALVQTSGVDPSWLTLEITETDAMADLATVIEQTGRIRMLGFNLSIDDFGTAYSSFFQLSQIPFSELKIERAFVENVHQDATKRAIVGACALLGREMGMQVVAEGVETADELQGIQAAGCSAAQGYLIARPMPREQAAAWLQALHEQQHTPQFRLRAG